MADAQRDYHQVRARASEALHQADQTHDAWVALNGQYQAHLNGTAARTGTGSAPAAAPPAPPPAPAPQGTPPPGQ